MDINIRLASQEDLPQIIEIEQLSFPPTEVATKEDFIKRFETFSENFFVTVIDEKIIDLLTAAQQINHYYQMNFIIILQYINQLETIKQSLV